MGLSLDQAQYNQILKELHIEARRFKDIDDEYTAVGYFSDSGMVEGSKLTKVELATLQEYGSSTIPARPFMGQTFDKRTEEIAAMSEILHAGYLDGTFGKAKALSTLGDWYTKETQKEIKGGDFVANAPSTIKRKGGRNTPLIDSKENLLNGISHKESI